MDGKTIIIPDDCQLAGMGMEGENGIPFALMAGLTKAIKMHEFVSQGRENKLLCMRNDFSMCRFSWSYMRYEKHRICHCVTYKIAPLLIS